MPIIIRLHFYAFIELWLRFCFTSLWLERVVIKEKWRKGFGFISTSKKGVQSTPNKPILDSILVAIARLAIFDHRLDNNSSCRRNRRCSQKLCGSAESSMLITGRGNNRQYHFLFRGHLSIHSKNCLIILFGPYLNEDIWTKKKRWPARLCDSFTFSLE